MFRKGRDVLETAGSARTPRMEHDRHGRILCSGLKENPQPRVDTARRRIANGGMPCSRRPASIHAPGCGRRARRALTLLLAVAMTQASAVETLPLPAGSAIDEAGYAVAVSDGWIAVGAPGENGGAGAVYVFDCRATRCLAPQRVVAEEAEDRALFGAAVAMDGVLLAIGAPGQDNGTVAVFARNGSTWVLQDTLEPDDEDVRFGGAVALSGARVIGGAALADGERGAAYVFDRIGGEWTLSTRLAASDGAARDRYGSAVALDGDVAIVGAPYRGDTSGRRGAAYVHRRVGGVWTQQATLLASTPATGARFGASVALDGVRAAVGAPDAAAAAGAVDTFASVAGSWVFDQRIVPAATAGAARFGWSVALDGDALAVGLPFAGGDRSAHCGGLARYVDAGTWLPAGTGFGPARTTRLAGWSVALDGVDLVAGLPADARGAPHAGSVQRSGGDGVLFADDYESPNAACIAP